MTLRIQCFSGPRNVSTALMYSWAQRGDTTVADEPLYAQYLNRFDRGHPMTSEVVASQSTDIDEVIATEILGPVDTPVLFIKQMAHHLRGARTDFLAQTENVLLTRDPVDTLASLSVHLPDCTLDDTGLPEQVELLDTILEQGGTPLVVDARALLTDPAAVLSRLCAGLGLDFDPAMLEWPAGPKPYDGVWAPAWYAGVHKSTGFAPYQPTPRPIPDRLGPVLDQAVPLYARLREYSIA